MTSRWSVAAAFSKSKGILRYFADFRGDSGSLALRVPPKVNFYTREVVECKKWAFQGKFIDGGGQKGTKENKVSLLWAASTAAAAIVTNDSFKSSTLPLQII